MITLTIAGIAVQTTDDGYLTDPKQWTKGMAVEIAKEHGIELSEKHWQIIEYLRVKQAAGEALTIRKVGTSGIADIKELYQLFPGGPLKISSRIAGIPKPVSCI